ncbi:hypothetical protein [Psychrobacter lutiphocae]|uniref:hypothetical protein n=1 Tax=Psychrobacter lutiphocae TaxID=540500 RepID=UPI0003811AFC|nr:hypothetical protein [Psychrobacter lutiphocae]
MTAATSQVVTQAFSVTNFDLNALHLLRSEIKTILKNAEKNLTEFYDNPEQAPLLLNSIAMLNQLAAVFRLIQLSGACELTEGVANAMQQLYQHAEQKSESLILSVSQAVIILARYIEFVLLQQTVEPSLLLPTINQLRQLTGQTLLSKQDLLSTDFHQITLANPARNFQPLSELNLDLSVLTTAYRSGLAVALAASDNKPLTETQKQQLNAMYQVCHLIASHTDSLFWQAAQTATKDIVTQLPLTDAQKRIFIFLDQQFHSYLPADDSRFADLVSYACSQQNELAAKLKQQLQSNQLDTEQLKEFARFIIGPDQAIATQLNELLQQEVDTIKAQIHELVTESTPSDDSIAPEVMAELRYEPVSQQLSALASRFRLLQMPQVSERLQQCAEQLLHWQHPTDADLDKLLADLMLAENAAITLSKSHTPGAQAWQLNNPDISIYQLESAYRQLTKACRHILLRLERSISDYLDPINPAHFDAKTDDAAISNESAATTEHYPDEMLHHIPETLQQIAGAIRFLDLTDAATILNNLALYLDNTFYRQGKTLIKRDAKSYAQFAKVADVLLAVDHQLSSREQQHPLDKHALQVGNTSLYQLISVA